MTQTKAMLDTSEKNYDDWSEKLQQRMNEAVIGTTFSNRMLMKPRRLKEIVISETNSFVQTMQADFSDLPEIRGQNLAQSGLGLDTILAITSSIRSTWYEMELFQSNKFILLAENIEMYCNSLLKGYMIGREIEIQKEQTRTQDAYIRILNKNQ